MKTISLLTFCSLILLAGCTMQDDPADGFKEIKLTEKTAQLIRAENQFGFELFRHVYTAESEHENIMVSPLSVSIALAMTYNGARADTKTAMEKTLKLYGLSPEEINESYLSLLNALKSLDEKVVLELANAIFYHDGFKVEADFISKNEYYYEALVSPLDFSAEQQSLNTINGWVDEKTHGKIESIIDRISPLQVMFLLNAIYFKGIWQKEFNEKGTKLHTFTTGKGETIQTEMMQRSDTLPYTTNDLFSAIQLSYGKGNYNMYVFLPHVNRTLQEITDNLNEKNWNNWMDGFAETENVDIRLPRFKYEYETELNDVLTDMGMGVAFTRDADFTGINPQGNLLIDYVKHKSFIEVNEEGTEAAAVTVVGIRFTSVGEAKRVPFYVDRPFLFAITEKSTGAVLFMGTVNNPSVN